MNLELLDPFQIKLPDRIDATLQLPDAMHFQPIAPPNSGNKSSKDDPKKRDVQKHQHDEEDWKAANHLVYNRRGTYVAIGYGSGTVAIFDTLSRTLSAVYRAPVKPASTKRTKDAAGDGNESAASDSDNDNGGEPSNSVGVTCVSWSKKSRTLLAGAAGETLVRLIDTTHPAGADECNQGAIDLNDLSNTKKKNQHNGTNSAGGHNNDDDDDDNRSQASAEKEKTERVGTKEESSFADRDSHEYSNTNGYGSADAAVAVVVSSGAAVAATTAAAVVSAAPNRNGRFLKAQHLKADGETARRSKDLLATDMSSQHRRLRRQFPPNQGSDVARSNARMPSIQFHTPSPVSSSLQVHPKDPCAGLMTLGDGSLMAFWVPHEAFEEPNTKDDGNDDNVDNAMDVSDDGPKGSTENTTAVEEPKVKLATISNDPKSFITCAVFDPNGERLFAATKDGYLLGFELGSMYDDFARADITVAKKTKPSFRILIPGGATVWHLLVSRNGQFLAVNSADAAIRLYSTKECWTVPEGVEKPAWVFQDVVNKVKFASCDISGDAEYLVAGANGDNNQYELYIWNTSTGVLMDKLKGSPVQLYSVAWHPARSFFACTTSDGLIDVWSPRINWTSFAPDFQALPANVEYVEQEDEFDIDEHENRDTAQIEEDEEDGSVDVITIEAVPVFASDSENEDDVFSFPAKVVRRMGTTTN